MKNKFKLQIILILTVILFCSTFAACSIGMDSFDEILQKNDLVAKITYFSNGGWFNNDVNCLTRDIYYKENSKAFEITDSTQTKIKHLEYLYAGWYEIETLEREGEPYFVCDLPLGGFENYKIDGKTVIEEYNGKAIVKLKDYLVLAENANAPLLLLSAPFDFSNETLKNGDELFLAAKWIPNQKVEYVLLLEDCSSMTVRNMDGTSSTYSNGEIVGSEIFDANGKFTVPTDYNLSPVESTDATFVDYYVYEDDLDPTALQRLSDVTSSLTRPEDGSNLKVLVKYTLGSWRVLRFPKDVRSIFSSPNNDYYLSRDIDCSDEKVVNVPSYFRGTIRGNGYTLTGIKAQALDLRSGDKASLFGEMTAESCIKDITFKDITLLVTSRKIQNSFISVFLISHKLNDEAVPTLSNVNFNGVTVDITLADGVSVENLPFANGSYIANNWIYAGSQSTPTSNQDFFNAFPTVKVENYQLLINETIASTDITAE